MRMLGHLEASQLLERDDFISDPIHYLSPLKGKAAALEQAALLQEWELPKEFGVLHRLLEFRMVWRGKWDYVRAFRLLETMSQEAELLIEFFPQRYMWGANMVVTNLAFESGPSPSARDGSPARCLTGLRPRPHPGDERRELPSQAQPGERQIPDTG